MHKAAIQRSVKALRSPIAILALFVFYLAPAFGEALSEIDGPKPNIILVMSDDMGWGELGMMGNKLIHTPNLDKLSAESLQFSNFNVAPSCAPTRAEIMSGRHHFVAGVTHTILKRNNLRDDITILPQVMKKGSYQTAMFGKWHLSASKDKVGLSGKPLEPHKRGFDHALWTFNQLKRFDPVLNFNDKRVKYKGFCADVLFTEAMKWMESADSSKPFFAYIPTSIPHGPIAAPQQFLDLYKDTKLTKKQQGYYAMVSALDANLGRLLKWQEQQTSPRETILIFMTDNGHAISGASGAGHDDDGFLQELGLYNAGMRGAKSQAWVGSTRVPFFIRWKGVTQAGKNNVLASATDLLPTFAAIAGVKLDDPKISGHSLLPDILGQTSIVPTNRILVSHRGRWPRSDQLEQYKYNYAAVYDKQYRMTWGKLGAAPELIDYIKDPGGLTDVSAQHPQVVQRYKKYLDRWWEEVKPEMLNDLAQIKSGNILFKGKGKSGKAK